ncbi:MAG: rhodanese-like domain-containing protein [Methanothrix sp.]|nr:rhodanese-like domain-containing protein [Methanothrix sp.]
MKISRMALILLMVAILAGGAVSSARGDCILCKGGSAENQQDVLKGEWAAFMGNENASKEVMISTGGLVNPRYNREHSSSLQSKKADDSAENQADSRESSSGSQPSASKTVNDAIPRGSDFTAMLASFDSINSSDIVLDISPDASEYIPGAINVPYTDFVEKDGTLKSVSKLASILGDAGISETDSVKIAGECQPCGGGPSAATFAYAVLKYTGQKDVKVIDGSIDDWVSEGRPTSSSPARLPAKEYAATIDADLMATYDFVHSGTAQIIDARSETEFKAGAIPGADNMPYGMVLDGKRLKDEAALKELFSSLRKDQPVVVYTNTGVKASMVWFALKLLNYDAKIYTWLDWKSHLPRLNIALKEAYANPNPAKIGDVVHITALFEGVNGSSSSRMQDAGRNGSEAVLTVKGCATCGFGSPQGYADLSSSDGTVKIGATTQAQRASAQKVFAVSAQLHSSPGESISKVVMKRVKSDSDEFVGIWNANVAAGTYGVDIIATLGDITETFPDALWIKVAGTSKYKNLENE